MALEFSQLLKKSRKLFVTALGFLTLATSTPRAATDPGLIWLTPEPGADLVALKNQIEQQGGEVVTLAPEGRLLIRTAATKAAGLKTLASVRETEPMELAVEEPQPLPIEKGLGAKRPTPEERERLDTLFRQVTSVPPVELSQRRAALQGAATLPVKVDNSVSVYFPPIRSQGSQGSCTAWAGCYYYNTFTQAKDEGLTVSGGDNTRICSPAFMYPLINSGLDKGAYTSDCMLNLNTIGCCSWSLKPYSQADFESWPSETAWVEAIPRRTAASYEIGNYNGLSEGAFAALKQHLANGNLAVTDTDVYSNFYNDYPTNTTGIDNGVLFANSGSLIGGHAMAIVGYDDTRPYFNGTTTKYGAFLLANSWGPYWGVTNTSPGPAPNKGFMWVAYDYFRATEDCFGHAYYNDDRPLYRSRLYAVTGLNHATRSDVTFRGGVGATGSPAWVSDYVIANSGGALRAVTDANRIAVDLNDGLAAVANFGSIQLFTSMGVLLGSASNGTITSAVFYHDFDHNGTFSSVASTDPVVTVLPGGTGHATVSFSGDTMQVGPVGIFSVSGPHGGTFTPASQSCTITNNGSSPMNWSASADSWITLSKTAGTLSAGQSDTINLSAAASANSLSPGTYAGKITITNTSSGNIQERAVALDVRPMTAMSFAAVPSPQQATVPFNVTISALDSVGLTAPAFPGTASLLAVSGGGLQTIGSGTNGSYLPMNTTWHDNRTQTLYLASELGAAGPIRSLALYVTESGGETLANWTIRMKHTTLTQFASATWEGTGWTTVYQGNDLPDTVGWMRFDFPVPFAYNGTDNLLIDFSFNSDHCTQRTYCRYSTSSAYRMVYLYCDSTNGDPLTWTGTTPTATRSTSRPNIQLLKGTPVSVTPATTTGFSGGVWSGSVTVPQQSTGVRIYAMENGVIRGISGSFDVGPNPQTAATDWQLFE